MRTALPLCWRCQNRECLTEPERDNDYGRLTTQSLGLVLGLPLRNRLPLHVARRVRSAALQRLDMIDHITGAPPARLSGGWTGMLPLEGMLGHPKGGCSVLNSACLF